MISSRLTRTHHSLDMVERSCIPFLTFILLLEVGFLVLMLTVLPSTALLVLSYAWAALNIFFSCVPICHGFCTFICCIEDDCCSLETWKRIGKGVIAVQLVLTGLWPFWSFWKYYKETHEAERDRSQAPDRASFDLPRNAPFPDQMQPVTRQPVDWKNFHLPRNAPFPDQMQPVQNKSLDLANFDLPRNAPFPNQMQPVPSQSTELANSGCHRSAPFLHHKEPGKCQRIQNENFDIPSAPPPHLMQPISHFAIPSNSPFPHQTQPVTSWSADLANFNLPRHEPFHHQSQPVLSKHVN